MIVLGLRTDKPEAELYLYDGSKKLAELKWQAHRQLAETIHTKIKLLLDGRALSDIGGIVFFEGPGSFTGLRIGASVTNALAYSLQVPIVALGGADWLERGRKQLASGDNQKLAIPKYGGKINISQPKK